MTAHDDKSHLDLRDLDVELQDIDWLVPSEPMPARLSAADEATQSSPKLLDLVYENESIQLTISLGQEEPRAIEHATPPTSRKDQVRTVGEDRAPSNRTVRYAPWMRVSNTKLINFA